MKTIKIEHEHRAIMIPDIGLVGDERQLYCDGAGAMLKAIVEQGGASQWRTVAPFPDTIDGVKAWGYEPPASREDADNEQPIDFPNYPKLGELQELPMPFGNSLMGAVSDWVETRSKSGLIISARWEFHRRSMMPYQWQVGPGRVSLWLNDVIEWRSIDELLTECDAKRVVELESICRALLAGVDSITYTSNGGVFTGVHGESDVTEELKDAIDAARQILPEVRDAD